MQRENRYLFLCALIVTAATFGLDEWTGAPPAAKPASALDSEFSAERAYALLTELLSEGVPHPVGSDANKRVRARIESYLKKNGITHEVQEGWGCAFSRTNCAWTENVIARIPGERDGPYVALMAHYDSAPVAPGAGDDGVGVVAVLESARILQSQGPRRNPLLLILTDGEETGLAGADAFFRSHRLASEVGVVLNFDGSGTTGPSMLLRTAGDASKLLSVYGDESKFPWANSIAEEVFKHMRSDTDFSVSRENNVPGIDFAFAGERAHYHTPNDNLDNLDKRTLQHHGENLLPTARRLLEMDLKDLAAEDNRIYVQLPSMGGVLAVWPQWANGVWLAIAGITLLAVLFREDLLNGGWRGGLVVLGGPLLVLTAAAAVGLGAFKLVSSINGTQPSWPATLWPYLLLLFVAPALGALAVGWALYRTLEVPVALAGAWCWWWLLGLAATIAAPSAAGVLLAPLLPAVVLLLITGVVQSPVLRTTLLVGTLVVATGQTLNLALALAHTQGYALVFAAFPCIALFLSVLVPMGRGRSAQLSTAGAFLLTVIGIIGAVTTPLYSAWRPQQVNIRYIENVDEGTAKATLLSPSPPDFLLHEMDFSHDGKAIYPWSDAEVDYVAKAPPSGWTPPEAAITATSVAGDTRTVDLLLQSPRRAHTMALFLPDAAKVQQVTLEGIELEPIKNRDGYVIRLTGMNDRPVHLQIAMRSAEPVKAWLVDDSTELPAAMHSLVKARPPLASPVGWGDSGVLAKSLSL